MSRTVILLFFSLASAKVFQYEEVKNYTFETVAWYSNPWGMTCCRNIFVTEKSGTLYQITEGTKTEIKTSLSNGQDIVYILIMLKMVI
jgi:hypothetical protein